MNKQTDICCPVTFNAYKHHFKFLYEMTNKWNEMEWKLVEKELKFMGNNLTDLYCGNMSVDEIIQESYTRLLDLQITNAEQLSKWLKPQEYRKINLSDNSLWVIKQGTDVSHYIHIHPAKNSPLTIRVRATTLKTVIALMIQSVNPENKISYDLETVNLIRTDLLGLSPVKSIEKGKGIDRIWSFFKK